jgi:glycosyltransferase involved in cell wall biosynthesis
MTSFPKIALVTETWPPEINGVAMTLSRLVEGMRRRGYPLQVIRPKQSCDVGSNANNFLVPGAPIPGYNGLLFGLPVRGRLLSHWKTQRPQLVHVATEGPLGWAALSAAHELKIPVTSSFHTQFHQYCGHYGIGWLQRVIASYLKNFHNKTLFTLVPNESLRGLLETEGYQNVGVLGRGIDTVLFDPARRSEALRTLWQADEDTLVVLHVGRLAAEKNLKTVIAAFDALHAKHAKAKMVWVGAGPQLTKMKRKLPDHIFVGMKVGEELATHYASADIFYLQA